MARFLEGEHLGAAIREVLSGDDVRCAVAFWGRGACNELFGTPERARAARILCDISMGGTNPDELVRLGAPANDGLRHVPGLHAKAYMSDRGLVVTSANASDNGIGFGRKPTLVECGTRHPATSSTYRDAASWFEDLWSEKAEVIDTEALEAATEAWKAGRRNHRDLASMADRPSTLLRRIAADPLTFRGVGIVFTTGESDADDVAIASLSAVEADDALPVPALSDRDRALLARWKPGDLFTNWSDAEANAWPRLFLCAHRGHRGAVSYWWYENFASARIGPDDWSVFAKPSNAVRTLLGLGVRHREAARPEDDLLASIFRVLELDAAHDDATPHMLCESPIHLGRLLKRIDDD